ncbi:sensor histidine kinase [Peristeroidobacter soli]|uniref:sensor histidine kinase n=1 Tax=Peristeroidobacter soli TaxID=2497877 RepID=UPI001C37CA87|nr:HAMP domain-containing sensor histidine kinase [Peristeroidobacter soli]
MNTNSRSLHWWISLGLIAFGLLAAAALALQTYRSQALIEHRIWRNILESVTQTYAEQRASNPAAPLPNAGILHTWLIHGDAPTPGMPQFLQPLPLGYHSSEGWTDLDEFDETFHALITPLDGGRLVTYLDIDELETQQNRDAMMTALWGIVFIAMIAALIGWLHANLVRPVRDLAFRMQAIDPAIKGQRLPTGYRQEEIQIIARASNAHLERVEKFIERERSLLDQASHEFRTPIAVIAGAVDILRMQGLPTTARPALERIRTTVEALSEIMVALLYLARETSPSAGPQEITAVHALLPRLVADHEYLLADKAVRFKVTDLEPTVIEAPEVMVRIAVGNLLRNAVENTTEGCIEVSISNGIVCISDSGTGFDPVEAARRYRDSLRAAMPIPGQGLGMFLISRICDRFGWQLSIETPASSGTRARLNVSASLLNDTDAP